MQKKHIISTLAIIGIIMIATQKTFAKITDKNTFRIKDAFGEGHFGASRDGGTRKHAGQDILATEGESVYSPIDGQVTRYPFVYGDDLRWKGIEIKNNDYHVKIFYLNSVVKIGKTVTKGERIGIAQNLNIKYKGITNHIHLEVRDAKTQRLLNPAKLF